MKGRLLKKAAALALSVLIVTGGVTLQPVADLVGDLAITASAEENTPPTAKTGLVAERVATSGGWKLQPLVTPGSTDEDHVYCYKVQLLSSPFVSEEQISTYNSNLDLWTKSIMENTQVHTGCFMV